MTSIVRPSILVVVFDSLAQSDIEAHGAVLPNLRRLRDASLTFSNAFVCSPESGPARASLFTGLDMAAHGVWTDGVALPDRETPFPEHFARNGYTTWLVGRRQLASVSNWTTEHARANEYHHFDWAHGPLHRSRQNAYLAWLQRTAPDIYAEIFPSQPNPDDTNTPIEERDAIRALSDALSFNTWVGLQAAARISEGSGDAPFLGLMSFVVGANMGGAPRDSGCCEGLDLKALRQADTALGDVLQALPKGTVVLVSAGRGTGSGPDVEHPLRERAIKVPLMVRRADGPAQSVSTPVSTTDIAPTLYDIANLQPPQRVQGTSLINEQRRGWALSRLRRPDQPQQTALRTDIWKLIMTHGHPDTGTSATFHLYDVVADPDETKDLAQSPEHHQQLENLIDVLIDARVAFEDRTEPRIAKF